MRHARSRVPGAVRRRRRRRRGRRPRPSPPRPRRRLLVGLVVLVADLAGLELGRDRRERLGERVGQVAEDVGRVVELDDLVGVDEVPPLAVGVVGDDLAAEAAARTEDEPLVVVVDDDHVAELLGQPGRATSAKSSSRRASARWLRSWNDRARSYSRWAAASSSGGLGQPALAGGPLVGRRRVGAVEPDRVGRRDVRRPRAGPRRRSARAPARRPRGRPRRTRRRRRPGCRARRARRRSR